MLNTYVKGNCDLSEALAIEEDCSQNFGLFPKGK
jgi:hypothetical protein